MGQNLSEQDGGLRLTGMVILACAAFNLWIFYLMFKHSVEHDMISTAN